MTSDPDHFDPLKSVHYIAQDPGLLWQKDPAIALDADSPLDSLRALTPNVITIDNGYRMYYTGLGPELAAKGSIGCILSAWSDDGIHWKKEAGIRVGNFPPLADAWTLCPDVIPLADGRWRMYFEARSRSTPTVVLSAISEDGLDWIVEEGIRVSNPDWSYGSPRCIYIPQTNRSKSLSSHDRYRLYFHHYRHPMRGGMDAQNHIISAISDDGLNFRLDAGVRLAQEAPQWESYAVYAPEVIRLQDGSYRMYYSSWSTTVRGGVFAARSPDGLNWSKEGPPILRLDRPLDNKMVSEPCVITLKEGEYRLYYEAQGEDGVYRILSATATHPTLK